MSSYRMSREPNDRKVFIGDLPRDIRREELRDICEKYGRVMDVWLARKPPGFGFVEFDDKRDANDAVRDLDGQKVFGRRVRAEISTDRSRRGAGGPKSDARCYECNDRGHYARECRERQRKRTRRDRSYSRDRSPSVRRHRSRSRSRRPARRSSRSSDRSSDHKQTTRRRRSASPRREVSRSRSASRGRRSVSKRRSDSRHRSVSRGKERSPSRRSRSSSKGRPSRSPTPKKDKRRKRSRSRSGSANGYDKKRGSPERGSHGKNPEWD